MICSITHTILCLRELPPAPRCMHATAVEARALSLVPTLCTHLPILRSIACPWRMRPCFSQAPCLQVEVCSLYSAVKRMGRRGIRETLDASAPYFLGQRGFKVEARSCGQPHIITSPPHSPHNRVRYPCPPMRCAPPAAPSVVRLHEHDECELPEVQAQGVAVHVLGGLSQEVLMHMCDKNVQLQADEVDNVRVARSLYRVEGPQGSHARPPR